VEACDKKELFERLGGLFETSGQLVRAKVCDSLQAREKLGSTAIGHGVAIPHGRAKGLRSAMGAFIRLKTPLPFDAPDGPVSLVFALMVPEHATDMHLMILGELAQPARSPRTFVASRRYSVIHRLLVDWPEMPARMPDMQQIVRQMLTKPAKAGAEMVAVRAGCC
jgi:PTS system nitrogen regulatory IIA component